MANENGTVVKYTFNSKYLFNSKGIVYSATTASLTCS